jgi:dipeptidase E
MKNNIFLTSESYTVLDDLVKFIDTDKFKKVLFIDTAGELFVKDKKETVWIDKSKEEIERLGFEMTVFSFTNKTIEEVEKAFSEADIVHIAGGNVFYLLGKVQEVDALRIIEEFVERGGIYIGQSAGAYLVGPSVEPAFKPERAKDVEKFDNFDGANLVDFTVLPHFGREDKRENYLNHRCEHIFGKGYKIILLTDQQYVRVREDGMYKIEEVKIAR